MILGIDIGQHLGWFLGDPVGPAEWGTFELANTTDLGKFLASSDPFWRRMLPRCTGVAIEKPFTAGEANYFPIRKNMAVLGHCHYWATFYPNVRTVQEISVNQGKLALSGKFNADKPEMIAAAATHGYEGMNEHEADALGVWYVLQFGPAETKQERLKREREERKGRSVLI